MVGGRPGADGGRGVCARRARDGVRHRRHHAEGARGAVVACAERTKELPRDACVRAAHATCDGRPWSAAAIIAAFPAPDAAMTKQTVLNAAHRSLGARM